jgi:hypothetical protein
MKVRQADKWAVACNNIVTVVVKEWLPRTLLLLQRYSRAPKWQAVPHLLVKRRTVQ